MDENFDYLYNEFFRRKKSEGEELHKRLEDMINAYMKSNDIEPEPNAETPKLEKRPELTDFLRSLFGSPNMPSDMEDIIKQNLGLMNGDIEANLGEPHKVDSYFDGIMFHEQHTWHTPFGDVIKHIISEEEFDSEIPLEIQLEDALAEENYERAAEIRDLINSQKKDK
jgi:hypothetical protein